MAEKNWSKAKYIIRYEGVFNYIRKRICGKRLANQVNELSDAKYLEKLFKCYTGKKLNLEKPRSYNEKLQWLKLYWRDPLAEQCSDKYEVRAFIQDKGCGDYLPKIYGIFHAIDEIDFNVLPEKFVIKTTHDSGGVYIVKDKSNKEISNAKIAINNALKRGDYTKYNKEWVYENIKPRIIVEELIGDGTKTPNDYKVYCIHGEPQFILVVAERDIDARENFYDPEWNRLYFVNGRLPIKEEIVKPKVFKLMLEISKKLSQPFPQARIDFYYEKNKLYIGEITFFSASGTTNFHPHKYNLKFGQKLDLSTIQNATYSIAKKQ